MADPDNKIFIEKLCIIGVGLIGGSFARALKQAGLVNHIVGASRREEHLQKAVDLGVIDSYSTDLQQAVRDADVIFISTPVGKFVDVLEQIKNHIKPEAIITDGGSTKGSVVEAAKAVFGEVPKRFIPGHPVAGTEKSGVEASFATLYKDRKVIITPLEESDPDAVRTVKALWQSTGADVISMDVEHHDLVLAATSHLPHLLAYSLVYTLATVDEKKEIFQFAAGGFRDFTRIASSDPDMWLDICMANKDALISHLDHFRKDLDILEQALKSNDSDAVKFMFTRAKKSRDEFCG